LPQLSMPPKLTSNEVMSEVHSNIALGKAVSILNSGSVYVVDTC
jgi:hypothetical protein